ncbi:MAG TPA: hypothetical protein VLS44_10035 [Nitrospira sp.]|nr:hypothetical protein [Nitrospira sp.]
MKPAPTLQNKQRRQEALLRSGMLDTEADQAFEDLVHLAAHTCDVTMASIDFLDRDREWLHAEAGLPGSEWSGHRSWGAHPNLHQPSVIAPHTLADYRSTNHPMVMAPLYPAYAGPNRSRKRSCWSDADAHTSSPRTGGRLTMVISRMQFRQRPRQWDP